MTGLNGSRHFRKIGALTAVSTLALMMSYGTALSDEQKNRYDIPAQSLSSALLAFSESTNINVVASGAVVKGKISGPAVGEYSIDEALTNLLKDSGVTYKFQDSKTLLIQPRAPHDKTSRLSANSDQFAMNDGYGENQNDRSQAQDPIDRPPTQAEEEDAMVLELEEIVVTGSHIRGVQSASPVQVFDREMIDRSGHATLHQFLQDLPQNFGGGVTENAAGFSPANDAGLNISQGAGINLRGQGADSTLVLLNGRRLSAAGFGQFVDISMIPVTAIADVAVLTDGASAIYGSDAVGGVVNFQLRKDYDGAETRLRYGTATEGDADEMQAGQTFGKTWDTGHGLISYEYFQRDPLEAIDKPFSEDAAHPTYLLPKQERHSVFATGEQTVAEVVDLFGTAFYTKRDGENFGGSLGSNTTVQTASETEQYGAVVGAAMDITRTWRVEVAGTYNEVKTTTDSERFTLPFTPGDTGTPEGSSENEASLLSLDAKADGNLFQISGGGVQLAVGGQFRREKYNDIAVTEQTGFPLDKERDVYALFSELFVPLFSADNRAPGFERLEFTAAVRYEDYDDFGSTTNPKFGLLWSPVEGVNLRGTYGTSFRAPQLRELAEFNLTGILFSVPNADMTDMILTLIGFGNNANLGPEKATTWTAGFDVNPASIPELNISMTYFNIEYEDRIESELAIFDIFTNPRFASLITENPGDDIIELFTTPPATFLNFAGADPADSEAFFDGRLRNTARTETSGLDVIVNYAVETDIGSLTFSFNSTYLFNQDVQVLPDDEFFDVVDTVNHPVNFRARGGISWAKDGFGSTVTVNYIDSYKDDRVDPAVDVSSHTTVDARLSYSTGDRHAAWLNNMVFSLNVQNVFNNHPPFVTGSFGNNVNFDPENANPLGRFIAFQVTKQW